MWSSLNLYAYQLRRVTAQISIFCDECTLMFKHYVQNDFKKEKTDDDVDLFFFIESLFRNYWLMIDCALKGC